MTNKMQSHTVEVHNTLEKANRERILLPIKARKTALITLKEAIIKHEEDIFSALKNDLGRARFETYVAEIAFIKEEINHALKSLDVWCKKQQVLTNAVLMPATSYYKPTPKGVVLIIAPWNYPFQLSLVPFVSAIAAGNCAIVKPSLMAIESSKVIEAIINNYMDNRCFRAIACDVEDTQALLDLPFDHIFYTGSSKIGSMVMARAAKYLTPVTLELGGKSPCIIDKDCNLKLSVKRIMWGKFLNAGQTCIAPDYVLIHQELLKDFITLAKKSLLSMFGDNPQESESFGRIVNERHFKRLISYLDGGEIAHGGNSDAKTNYLEPTILVNIKENALVMAEEIFGPILPVVTVSKIDDAIDFINKKPNPLALYIFSNNKVNIKKTIDFTLSGGVGINDCLSHVAVSGLPFGGVRESGLGSYHGIWGFNTFSHMRAIHKRSNFLDNPIKYAPYSEQKLNLARILL